MLDYYNQTAWADLLELMFGKGFFLAGSWLFVGVWVMLAIPDEALPPLDDREYSKIDIWKWLWFKGLSFDQ